MAIFSVLALAVYEPENDNHDPQVLDEFSHISYLSFWNEPDGDWAFRNLAGKNTYLGPTAALRSGWKVHGVNQRGGAGNGGLRVRGAVASSTTGDMTILLVNDDDTPTKVDVRFDESIRQPMKFNHLVLSGEDRGKMMVEKTAIQTEGMNLPVILPPRLIVTLTSLPLGDLTVPQQLSLVR